MSCFFLLGLGQFLPIVFLRMGWSKMFDKFQVHIFPLSECDSNLQIPQNLVIVMDNAFVQCYQHVEKTFK